jgi:hypothetical protein
MHYKIFVIVRRFPSAKLVDLFGEWSALRPGRSSLRDIVPGTRRRGDCGEWGRISFRILTKISISPSCSASKLGLLSIPACSLVSTLTNKTVHSHVLYLCISIETIKLRDLTILTALLPGVLYAGEKEFLTPQAEHTFQDVESESNIRVTV